MTPKQQVADGLDQARAAVRRASHALDLGDAIDLREIERQVDLAAAAATDLRPDDKTDDMRRELINLVTDLDGLHRRIAAERRRTADQLGRSTVSRRAFVAYGQRLGA